MFARTMLYRMRHGGHSTRGFLRLLLLALPILASLIPSADRARACIGRDGTPPPWGRTKPNQIMVDQINLAHAIAKANGEQTPVTPPVLGSHKTVIILVENAAKGAPFNSNYRSASLWSNRLKQFDNYYNEVSRGKLRIVPAAETFGTANDGVIGPVTVSNLTNAETDGDYGAEAVAAANPYINFAAFDTNHDGKITATELHILIYQAGYETSYNGTATTPTPRAWAHTTSDLSGISGNDPGDDSDGKTITSYCYCGSVFTPTLMATQGQMTHELGHDLGLPDLYDTDPAPDPNPSAGLGMNCLMASGSWGGTSGDTPTHIDPYYRNWLGWETQVTVTTPVNQIRTLLAANGNNQSLKILVPGSFEFFLVENRQQTGFDAGLPGTQGGLLVYHCDALILGAGIAINNNPLNMGISLEEADGDSSMIRQTGTRDRGQDTDYFRSGNKTSFNNTTTPNSRLKSGAASNINIWGIGASGNSMTFNVGTVAPQLTTFLINAGAATTENRNVTLNSTYNTNQSPPTQYMASESSNFAGATWKTWAASVPFTLSPGNVTKRVYFKVQNSIGQSSVFNDTIGLEEIGTLPLSTTWTPSSISPVGDLDWFKITVTTPGRYAIETWVGTLTKDVLQLYGPNNRTTQIASDNGANGTRMARIEYNLTTAGTYYIRCLAYNWLYDTGTYSIRVFQIRPPAVSSYGINNGANFTTTRTVLLNNTVLNPGTAAANTPAEYLASEDFNFTGAVWKPYSGAPKYTMTGAGDGLKAVYFKLRNSAGESYGWIDTINLKSITLNALIVYASTRNTTVAADIFYFLKSRGMTTGMIPMSALTNTNLTPYQVIILCDDTGSMETWGTSAAQINYLSQSGKPIVGLGEGGYAFFGKLGLSIGYGLGTHGLESKLVEADNTHTIFNMPRNLATANPRIISIYTAATNTIGFYVPTLPADVTMLGTELSASTYCPLACEGGRFTLWGFSGAPSAMTAAGKDLFENVVRFTAGLGTW